LEQVTTHRADDEPGYRVTQGGLDQLWDLVGADRLEEGERISLCLALSELESSRLEKLERCGARKR
jgi:hypothetical protein